ncbi:CopG family transcriptional regulator [Dactylosporangium sucinum]|uniref:Ribbon-helix-helix protein CopG domain-containing protein n=1 Tax=Dactylosporangium sucinum TaxID=1424081 RepID=A0A917WWZ1_9ACTN|nr:CopG family transcriptional regulator [Dactylosporangium sucinum]GGM37563.1 hypothetical protein GCM10007977_043770 [Dactylosporangium sucinum]
MTDNHLDEGDAFAARMGRLTAGAEATLPEPPPSDTPEMVVRRVRLPSTVDEELRRRASARGVSPSALIRDLVVAALAGGGTEAPDLMAELRGLRTALQHAVDRLAAQAERDG